MQAMTIREFLNKNNNTGLSEQEQRALDTLELILRASFLVSSGVIAVDTMEAIGGIIEAFQTGKEVITAFKIK